jgi:hypothetical protein
MNRKINRLVSRTPGADALGARTWGGGPDLFPYALAPLSVSEAANLAELVTSLGTIS